MIEHRRGVGTEGREKRKVAGLSDKKGGAEGRAKIGVASA